jgi:hypothetical protein
MTREELARPANHLRACDISDQAKTLSDNQQDTAGRDGKEPPGKGSDKNHNPTPTN